MSDFSADVHSSDTKASVPASRVGDDSARIWPRCAVPAREPTLCAQPMKFVCPLARPCVRRSAPHVGKLLRSGGPIHPALSARGAGGPAGASLPVDDRDSAQRQGGGFSALHGPAGCGPLRRALPGGDPQGGPIGHDAPPHQGRAAPVRRDSPLSGTPRLHTVSYQLSSREAGLYEAVTHYGGHTRERAARSARAKRGAKADGSANFTRVISGAPISGDKIRTEGRAGRLGARLTAAVAKGNLIPTQAKRNLSSRSGIGGVRSAT